MPPRPHPTASRLTSISRLGLAASALALLPFASCLSRAAEPRASQQEEASEPIVEITPAESVSAAPPARAGDEIDVEALSEHEQGSWPVIEPSDVQHAPIDPERALASIAKETFVFAEPRWRSKKIGYLRAGAIVRRSREPKGKSGCEGGWYSIEPEGYVCV